MQLVEVDLTQVKHNRRHDAGNQGVAIVRMKYHRSVNNWVMHVYVILCMVNIPDNGYRIEQ